MSQRQASAHFKICRSTIKNKLKCKFQNKPGHPNIFNVEEELSFASHIDKLCEYGFPVDDLDLRFVVKTYLTRQGKSIEMFRNNLPGRDWVKSFLKRHPQLTVRFAANIKRVRASINEQIVSEYIDNIDKLLKDVPPENIYNFDETNMTDDPGRKKVICRRGSKYPERIMNSTKSSTTVMFCANAAGQAVPPYIIYKAEHLWSTWTENGPPGSRYNRTKHGWMDLATFEEWFSSHMLPILKKQEGTKIMIGDNLTSHLSLNVVRLCEENNICFVCLPPNSSHLTQPLDVAYFRPLKMKWRETLSLWKQSDSGKAVSTLPKDMFPKLLKKVLDDLEGNMSSNIVSGFRKAGVYPVNKQEILNRLPTQDRAVNLDLIGETFLSHLEQKRNEIVTPRSIRRKKLNVPPGQSVTEHDLLQLSASTQNQPKNRGPKKQHKKKRDLSSSEEDNDNFSLASSGHSDFSLFDSEDETVHEVIRPSKMSRNCRNGQTSYDGASKSPVQDERPPETASSTPLKNSVKEGKFVVIVWEGKKFPGLVMSVTETGAIVDCMEPTKKAWKWPKDKDMLFYKWCDILKIIEPPTLIKRGFFSVNIE